MTSDERITALEKKVAALQAEVEAMRPLVADWRRMEAARSNNRRTEAAMLGRPVPRRSK